MLRLNIEFNAAGYLGAPVFGALIYNNPGNPLNGLTALAGWNPAYFSFTSAHEGGGFFAFLDGQVRFISENIDTSIYRDLSTIAGNELIDDEDY